MQYGDMLVKVTNSSGISDFAIQAPLIVDEAVRFLNKRLRLQAMLGVFTTESFADGTVVYPHNEIIDVQQVFVHGVYNPLDRLSSLLLLRERPGYVAFPGATFLQSSYFEAEHNVSYYRKIHTPNTPTNLDQYDLFAHDPDLVHDAVLFHALNQEYRNRTPKEDTLADRVTAASQSLVGHIELLNQNDVVQRFHTDSLAPFGDRKYRP